MKLLPALIAAALATTGHAQAQADSSAVIHLKNGTSVTSNELQRKGNELAVTVQLGGVGRSETKYPIDTITRIDFPRIPAIRAAEDSLNKNNAKAALSTIDPVVREQEVFLGIPGNKWSAAAVIKVKALVALGLYDDAGKLIDSLTKHASPDETQAARLQMAIVWAKQGGTQKAREIYDDVITNSTDPGTVAQAWVGKGDALLAAKDYDSALLSFLRVPVFYPDDKASLPPALLGSARAYLRIDETEKARTTLDQIISTYPASPSAEAARAELKKLDGDKLNPS
jgi:tetratricopeptide (TPR) repeat protein